MIHKEQHPMADAEVIISAGKFAGQAYRIEDWWDRLAGKSWMWCDGNPACLEYAIRSAAEGLPTDDNVVYGKIDGLGKLIHTSQFSEAA